jgi:hypothetical protein
MQLPAFLVQIVSVEFEVDLGLGKGDRPVPVNSNRCIWVKNIFGWSAVVFCGSEIVQMFSFVVVLCINLTSGCVSQAVIETRVFGRVCTFPPAVVAVPASCILLSKGHHCFCMPFYFSFRLSLFSFRAYFLFPLLFVFSRRVSFGG